jgi:hypothetical protein
LSCVALAWLIFFVVVFVNVVVVIFSCLVFADFSLRS